MEHCINRTAQLLGFGNPYVLDNPFQTCCYAMNHEIKETLADDSVQNWVVFDHFAPTVATWYYAEFDENGVVTNGTLGSDGYVHLPLFLDVFPDGGLLSTFQENGDAVSYSIASYINSYKVDGWFMTNNPNSNFWKGYYLSNRIKWDHNGNVENPLQPFAGLHELMLFLDYSTGDTFISEVLNYGPVTYSQRGDFVQNNFPPDYTFISFEGSFIPTGIQNVKAKKLIHK